MRRIFILPRTSFSGQFPPCHFEWLIFGILIAHDASCCDADGVYGTDLQSVGSEVGIHAIPMPFLSICGCFERAIGYLFGGTKTARASLSKVIVVDGGFSTIRRWTGCVDSGACTVVPA
jgi:hypothetical protein